MIIIAFCAISIYAQDVIFKTSGDSLIVNVQNVDENTILFSYPNETLTNKLGVESVIKIRFASGREQVFPQVIRIPNNNLKIEKHIEVSNTTAKPIKLKVTGIHKNTGASIILYDGEILDNTICTWLDVTVYKARLDHYASFIVSCDEPNVVISYESSEDLKLYFRDAKQKQSNVIMFENIYNSKSRVNDNIKITNNTSNNLTIVAYAIMKDGNERINIGQKTFKSGADEENFHTKANSRKVSKFYFEILDGEFKDTKMRIDDDDLCIIID